VYQFQNWGINDRFGNSLDLFQSPVTDVTARDNLLEVSFYKYETVIGNT
jgi:hypothetical protein